MNRYRRRVPKGVAPDVLKQLLPPEDLMRMPHEKHQQIELARSEHDELSAYSYVARGYVHIDARGRKHLRPAGQQGERGALCAPKDRFHPRGELSGREGLPHVVVRAELQPHDPIMFVAPG